VIARIATSTQRNGARHRPGIGEGSTQHARTARAEKIEAAAAVDTANTWLEADATTQPGAADY